MLRRSISLLVLAAFAVAQLATIPHAHEGIEGDDHGAVPHVHMARLGGDHHENDHGHGHSHDGHSHACQQEQPETAGQACMAGVPADHDEDAVYLPSLTTSTFRSGVGNLGLSLATLWVPVDPLQVPTMLADGSCFVDSGPPLCGGGCALYLSLRTLRI